MIRYYVIVRDEPPHVYPTHVLNVAGLAKGGSRHQHMAVSMVIIHSLHVIERPNMESGCNERLRDPPHHRLVAATCPVQTVEQINK